MCRACSRRSLTGWCRAAPRLSARACSALRAPNGRRMGCDEDRHRGQGCELLAYATAAATRHCASGHRRPCARATIGGPGYARQVHGPAKTDGNSAATYETWGAAVGLNRCDCGVAGASALALGFAGAAAERGCTVGRTSHQAGRAVRLGENENAGTRSSPGKFSQDVLSGVVSQPPVIRRRRCPGRRGIQPTFILWSRCWRCLRKTA
jgi:hypothetical protein